MGQKTVVKVGWMVEDLGRTKRVAGIINCEPDIGDIRRAVTSPLDINLNLQGSVSDVAVGNFDSSLLRFGGEKGRKKW
jgi:hypothetical protein